MTQDHVLILGARSDMALAIAHKFAAEGYAIQLAARNSADMEDVRADMELRYSHPVTLHEFDALDIQSHEEFVATMPVLPRVAVCAVGYMGEQGENERDMMVAAEVMRSNFEGPASILGVLANAFEKRRSGTLVGISSVAGDRGRATNYVYGASKAGFTAFLSGMRNRLAKTGVHVVTVLPGFVNTKMTEGMGTPAPLTAQPDEVAEKVYKAIKREKNVIYVKSVWWFVMMIIRNIPEFIFKRLTL